MAGVSINDILHWAVSDRIYLGAMLAPFTADGRDYAGRELSHAHWRQVGGKSETCILPHEAKEILLSGSTMIAVWREPGYENGISIPQLGDKPVVYFLREPQTVGRDTLWVYEDELPMRESATNEVANPVPMPVQRWQEDEILRVLKELGYTAKGLPKGKNGTAGVKSEVKKALSSSGKDNWLGTIFEKAWERLMGDERIAYKATVP